MSKCTGDSPLLAVARKLEPSLGVRLNDCRLDRPDDNENVESLAEATELRCRRVLLDGPWWREESGPMLARILVNSDGVGVVDDRDGESHESVWVALLPSAGAGYTLHVTSPVTGCADGMVIDAALAARLSSFAWTLNRTFPKESLKVPEILKFGLHGNKPDLRILLVVSIMSCLLALLMPIVSASLIDTVIPSGDRTRLWQLMGGLLLAGFAAILFDVLKTVAMLRVDARTGLDINAAVLDRVLTLPTRFFRQYSSGDLALRMSAVNSLQQAITGNALGLVLQLSFLVGNLALMLYYSARMTLMVFLVAVLLALISGGLGYARLQLHRQIEALSGKLRSQVFEYLKGITKIRTSACEQRAYENWRQRYGLFRGLHVRDAVLGNAEGLLMNIFSPGMLIFVYYLASVESLKVADGAARNFSTGDFVAFNTALFSLLGGLLGILGTLMGLLRLMPVWERAKPIVDTVPERSGKKSRRHDPCGAIEMVNLSFSYPDGPPVIVDINIKIAKGSLVAIVGASGSGKSTLMRLLLGFEAPTKGSIFFDGHDLAELDAGHVRRKFGTVLQGGRLWSGDLYSNIVGSRNLPIEEAWDAAQKAGLKEDIEAMPMGMYTVVGDGDSTLSGGQRQRVLIARALISAPTILLLDEATSALDNHSQAVVQKSLSSLNSTRIVIAHRLNTVRHADWIFVMNQGHIVQQGTYDTLASEQGEFAELLNRQLA